MSYPTDEKLLLALGQAVRRQRASLGFSQETFAERANLHRTYIGSIERGERNISFLNLARVAHALGMRPADLVKLMEEELGSQAIGT